MGYSLEDKALCEALSYAFIDTEIDYAYIASVAKNYPKEHVENLFFNYVAPSCYYNTVAPIPSVIYFLTPKNYMQTLTLSGKERKLHMENYEWIYFVGILGVNLKANGMH